MSYDLHWNRLKALMNVKSAAGCAGVPAADGAAARHPALPRLEHRQPGAGLLVRASFNGLPAPSDCCRAFRVMP